MRVETQAQSLEITDAASRSISGAVALHVDQAHDAGAALEQLGEVPANAARSARSTGMASSSAVASARAGVLVDPI